MTETPFTTQAPPPGAPPQGPPSLTRSRYDRKVAGVCGGLGQRLGIDPLILRVIVVVLTIFGGSGLVLYALGWLLIPDEGALRSVAQQAVDQNGRPGDRSGAATVVIGVLAGLALLLVLGGLAASFGFDRGGFGLDVWPLVVIGGIGAAIWYANRTPTSVAPPTTGSSTYTPFGPYGPAPSPAEPSAAPSPSPAAAAWETGATTPVYATSAPTYQPPVVFPSTPRPPRRRSVLGRLTLSVAVVAAGIMVLLDRTGAVDLRASVFFGVLLAIVGLGLLVGAFIGRARGLIVVGIILALCTAGAGSTHLGGVHSTGDITWRPLTASSVPSDGYSWAAGDVKLDLTALPGSTDPVSITAQLGAGTLVVTVPADAVVHVKAVVGVGTLRLPGDQNSDGFGRTIDTTLGTDLIQPAHQLTLDLSVGAGTVEVRRASS